MRLLVLTLTATLCAEAALSQTVPAKIPHRASSQLADGFGVNVDLPRSPRMPWTKTWTPLFDAGVKWVRVGQYENSSEQVSWDWVEQTPGHFEVPVGAEEAVRSLVENGVDIEIELEYANPLYAEDAATRLTRVVLPPPSIGPGDRPTNPIFLAPKTPEQVDAFLRYAKFMVDHFKGKVGTWELWNEENLPYWSPDIAKPEKAKWYGRVFCQFADTVHETNPAAKVMFGGLAEADLDFALGALPACPEKADIMAYHSYPGGPFGIGRPPEEIDPLYGGAAFRRGVMSIPGIRPDLEFCINEWNVTPKAKGSNQSVQARYLPRFYLEQLAHGIKGAIWVFMPSTDGNEDNMLGILEGDTLGADAFRPREAFGAFQNLSAVFGQTKRDPGNENILGEIKGHSSADVRAFWFRDDLSGKRIFAYWLALPADPKDDFKPINTQLHIDDPAIKQPILIDIRTGDVSKLKWKSRKDRTIMVPVKDSVMAVADATYIDWQEVPSTPGGLVADKGVGGTELRWDTSPDATQYELQYSADYGHWTPLGQVAAGTTHFSDSLSSVQRVTYKVRAINKNGASPWSNPAWIGQ